MSKERARRRAEREAEQARQAALRAEREARLARRRERVGRVVALLPGRPVRIVSQGGIMARRRRTQNGVAAVLFLIVQVIVWLLWSSWAARFGALVLSLLLLPLLITLVFDRRS
ncbi:hypothetical protein ABT352_40280 [Streptosporangium sp. NPDC000563]|uniref:hypothetical protein n=1 Tax=unclassified Streptosporangium TaxID=2632669 RepID=UPI00331DC988